jgi:hypothetical protein
VGQAVEVAVAQRGRKRQERGLIALAFIFALAIYFIAQREWLKAALCISIIVSIPSWYFAIKMSTKCRVTFTATGLPCRNPANGVIFGCRVQRHYWPKALARIGIHRQQIERLPVNKKMQRGRFAAREKSVVAREVVAVRIEPDLKSNCTFYLTAVSTACTVATTIIAIFG